MRRTVALLSVAIAACLSATPVDAALPAQGSGTATSQTTNPNNGTDFASMNTTFSPAHIEPGEPFSFSASMNVYEVGFYDENDCTGFVREETENYDTLGMWRVSPRSTVYDDPAPEQLEGFVLPTPAYSNFTKTTAPCPDGTYEEHGTATVPGETTAQLTPGCYQASAWESSIWFRDAGVAGSLGTLTVGDVSCARKKEPVPEVECSIHKCEVDFTCPESICNHKNLDLSAAGGSSGSCDGGGNKRGPCGGFVKSASFFTVASGPIDLLPNQTAQVTLPLTRKGRKAVAKALRDGRDGPFTGRVELAGDRSTRQAVTISLK
jgi:hypothetical protein